MARRRNIIAQFVNFDMAELAARIQGMTDAQIGAWWRKAVIDCCSGCIDPKTDPIIRARYDRAIARMIERQDQNSRAYQNRKNRLNDQETATGNYHIQTTISTSDQAGNPPTRESETRGPQTDNNLAESATRTSEAVKALADVPTREDGKFKSDSGDAGNLESATSAKTLGEARESRRTGGTPKRVEKPTASHAETLPVRSPDLFGEGEKKPYGTCKNVLLSDADGHHLREVYGQDLATAIEILDSALENNPKLKKRYKNHAAVLRYGNWVWQEVQKIKERQVRLETAEINKKAAEKRAANGDGRTFKQKDSDDRNEWLRTSMFTNEAANG